MYFLEAFFIVLIILVFVVVLYIIAGDFDDKIYHVTDDCTVLVLKKAEDGNGVSCTQCHFVSTMKHCPVDNEAKLKCDNKDKEIGNDSNHIWEVVN